MSSSTSSSGEIDNIKYLDLSGQFHKREQSNFGGFSDIWRGTLQKDGTAIEVAIKELRVRQSGGSENSMAVTERLKKRCFREVLLWRTLQHPKIVPLLGFSMDPYGIPALISPWYPNGNVVHFLNSNPDADRPSLALDAADGLTYLHSIPIVHGDLKAENVLVDAEGRASLCDFGMSQFIDEATRITGFTTTHANAGGTDRFLSPELLSDEPKTVATDIWAFACLVVQILTGRMPYEGINQRYAVLSAIMRGEAPIKDHKGQIDKTLWNCLERCWSMNPEDRPGALWLQLKITQHMTSQKHGQIITSLKGLQPLQLVQVSEDKQVASFELNSNGTYLAASCFPGVSPGDNAITIWRIEAGMVSLFHTCPCDVAIVSWSRSGDKLLVRRSKSIEVWGIEASKMVLKYKGSHSGLDSNTTWLPRGDTIASVVENGILLQHLISPWSYCITVPVRPMQVTFTPDNNRMLVVGKNMHPKLPEDGISLVVFSSDSPEFKGTLPLTKYPNQVITSEVEEQILVTFTDSPAELWQMESVNVDGSENVGFIRLHTYVVFKPGDVQWNNVQFGGKGDQFVIGLSSGGEIHIWDRASAVHLHSIEVTNIDMSWDLKLISVSQNDTSADSPIFALIHSSNVITLWGVEKSAGVVTRE